MSTPDICSGVVNEQLCPKATVSKCASIKDSIEEGTPEWLTKCYMENALRNYHADPKLKVLKMQAKPALGRGENYGGVLTRVSTEFRPSKGPIQTHSYIVKTSFEGDEFSSKIMEPYDIFNREIEIYEQVLPKFKALLKEIGDPEQIFAETVTVDRNKSAMVFEDLNEKNFIMPDRLLGLDLDLTKIVLRKLAKMHACSAVLNERENKCLERYDRGMFNRHTENYAPCYVGLLEACARRVKQMPNMQVYAEKLMKLKPQYMELAKRVFDPTNNHLNVFAHGDLWTNNFLVKYCKDTKKPIDVMIIDFQYSAWGSPGIDLFYFMNSSMVEDLHLNAQEELIHYYYGYLADTLRKLNFGGHIPSMHQFHQQMQQKLFYGES